MIDTYYECYSCRHKFKKQDVIQTSEQSYICGKCREFQFEDEAQGAEAIERQFEEQYGQIPNTEKS